MEKKHPNRRSLTKPAGKLSVLFLFMLTGPALVDRQRAAGPLHSTAWAAENANLSDNVTGGQSQLSSGLVAGEPTLKMLEWPLVSLAESKPRLQPLFNLQKLLALAQPVRGETLQSGQNVGAFLRNRESSVSVEPRLQKLANRAALQLLPESPVRAFFGLLHAHTFSSDGLGDARDAFRMAREIAGLDFFAVTDHSEYWWKKASPDWARQQILAREESRPDFIGLAGFEYSHPLQGHVVVLNSPQWTSFLQAPSIDQFFDWFSDAQQSSALAIFAHPGFHTYRNWFDLRHLRFDSRLEDRMIGLETIHKNVWERSFKGYKKEVSFLEEAIAEGWRVGPVASQDNHTPYWGVSDQSRIAVLMNSLSHHELIEALRRRHFYSTQSPQLQLAAGLYDRGKLMGIMGDVVEHSSLSGLNTFLRFRIFEPNPLMNPYKIEFLINGRIARTLTFLDSPSPMSNRPAEHESRRPSWWDRWLYNGIITMKPFEVFFEPAQPAEPEIFEADIPLKLLPCKKVPIRKKQDRMSLAVRFYQGGRGQYLSTTSPIILTCR